MEMKDVIKSQREKLKLTYEEIGNYVGVGKSTVKKWESGYIANMRRDKIQKLAEVLQVTPEYLMGWGTELNTSRIIEFDSEYLRRIPLVGRAAASNPMSAIENPGEYIVIDTRINKVNGNDVDGFYALEVVGQSMEPTIHDGEIVMVRKQPVIEPGQIGVFRCNGDEATIKRFAKEGGKVYLVPENKQFPVQEYTNECVCEGKVMESIRRTIK